MEFKSINPYDGRLLNTYKEQSESEVERILNNAHKTFNEWKLTSVEIRTSKMANAARILKENKEEYSRMITSEMGKPITESKAEILKCAWVCEHYAEHAVEFLKDEMIGSDAQKSYVRSDPKGVILAIMPWNFPFWQVFRFAAPALCAGNTALLKHAPNVFGCAKMIEDIFLKAGFPQGVFQNLILHHDKVEKIIAHEAIKAVSLTGSERAGSAVAENAGRYLKKCVLELGGNNAFIVWEDADIDESVRTAVKARMLNAGQSCIAAKRFIIHDAVYDVFIQKFIEEVEKLRKGDPMKKETQIGPLARPDLAEKLHEQIQKSVAMGAKLAYGGKRDGCFHEPCILTGVVPGMPAFDDETFGPLAAFTRAKDRNESVKFATTSRYGLGISLCTKDLQMAEKLAGEIPDGAFFINELVKSDPRLPFGGELNSGYGRELSRDGMMEFVNRKTVFIK